jgi:hypothetical protein
MEGTQSGVGAVTVKPILGFKRISTGVAIRTSTDQVRVGPGPVEHRPVSYLMARNIHPYAVDFERAIVSFIETNREIDHNKASFLHLSLCRDAKNLVEVGIAELLELVASLQLAQDPELIFIHHPGRVGSTLLHKLLGSHPDVESISEDLILENFLVPEQGVHAEQVYRAVVLLTACKLGVSGTRRLAFKFTGFSSRAFDMLLEVFPRARHLYLTRDPVRIAESWINVWRGNWLYRLFLPLRMYNFRFVPYARVRVNSPFAAPGDPYFDARKANQGISKRYINLPEASMLAVMITDQFFEARAGNPNLLRLQYEDILAKDRIRQKLDRFLGFDLSGGVDEAQYGTHSQLGDRAETKRFRYHRFNARERAALAEFQMQMSQMIAEAPPHDDQVDPDESHGRIVSVPLR